MKSHIAQMGDTVKIHYTVRGDNDRSLESTRDGDPMQFVIGNGEVIPGLESEILGMEAGESKKLTVPPEKAFGPVKSQLIGVVEKKDLPGSSEPTVGQRFEVEQEDRKLIFRITEVKENTVILDANHPLAGETLKLDVEMVEIMR